MCPLADQLPGQPTHRTRSGLCGSQVGYIVRQMIHYAVRSGCRYGLLTDMHHLIVFRFVTEVVEREVCCRLAVQSWAVGVIRLVL